MKKILLVLVAILSVSVAVQAQNINGEIVISVGNVGVPILDEQKDKIK